VSVWGLLLTLYAVGAVIVLTAVLVIMRSVNKRKLEHPFPWDYRRVLVTIGGTLLWPLVAVVGLIFLVVISFPSGRLWLTTKGWIPDLSSIEGGGGLDTLPPSPRWWSYTATRLAHFQPLILLLFIVINLASVYPRHNTTFSTISFLCLSLVLVSIFAESHHERRLCERCAAATPVDGEAAVQRRRPWLRFQHWHSRHRIFGVILWAAGLVIPLMTHFEFEAALTYLPLYLYWSAETMANLRHRPVMPWCPQCKGWGWGEDIYAPITGPTGQGHK
jgi:hypothetical protein